SDQEEGSRHRCAATLLPSGLSSTAARPNCLASKPSVQGKAAVGEKLGRAIHRCDFVQQFAREEYDLVLPWNDRLIAALADVNSVFQMRVMNAQFTAFELAWLAMEKIDEGQISRGHAIARVVAVEVEEVAVVARGNLRLNPRNRKFLHTQFHE